MICQISNWANIMLNESLFASEKLDWETPHYLFRHLDREFGFDLDVCANDRNAKCERFFDEQKNGLAQKWTGRVWMNPPYGRGIACWVEKALSEVACGNAEIAVCLVSVRSDSRWWHQNCMKASEIRLMDQRLEFEGANNKAPFPTALVIFRADDNSEVRLRTLRVRPLRQAA